jgi:hypothetical protein
LHTFLALAGTPSPVRTTFATFVERLRRAVPWTGDETVETVELPAHAGGFVTIASPAERDRFDVWSDGSLTVLFDGELFGVKAGLRAQAAAERFRRGGAPALCASNGAFSAVLFEATPQRVTLASDAIGARALRWVDGATLAASPHDLSLACAGHTGFELDLVSAAASVACDWSIGGRSLLRGVRTADPLEIVAWEPGGAKRSPVPALADGGRIDPADGAAVQQTLDAMIEGVGGAIADVAAAGGDLEIELTAGLDTRAVLAAAARRADPARIRGVTRGRADSLDAIGAARIARRLGVRHAVEPFGIGDAASAARDVDLLAFHLSGDTCAKRVGDASFRGAEQVPRLDGTGGEIFRAYYHPHAAAAAGETHDALALHLARRFPRLASLPWLDPALPGQVRGRIADRFGALAAHARAPRDALDLFYACERVGRWGAMRERHPVRRWLRSPFRQPDLLRLHLHLPAGAGAASPLHRRILERFAPEVRGWPVNGRYILPGEHEGAARRYARKLRQTVARRRVRSGGASLDREQAELLRGPLAELVNDSVLAERSLARQLFTRPGIERLVAEHARGERDHTELLGLLLTAERWHTLLAGVKSG